MNAHDVIRGDLDMAEMVAGMYLNDMDDKTLMTRPHQGCNHVNWQIGHLISSEHAMMEQVFPGRSPALPEGFSDKYDRKNSSTDEPAAFCDKATLMEVFKTQRDATRRILDSVSEEDLDGESPESMKGYAPTIGSIFALQGSHWMMHCGQWVVVRRLAGLPVVM